MRMPSIPQASQMRRKSHHAFLCQVIAKILGHIMTVADCMKLRDKKNVRMPIPGRTADCPARKVTPKRGGNRH